MANYIIQGPQMLHPLRRACQYWFPVENVIRHGIELIKVFLAR